MNGEIGQTVTLESLIQGQALNNPGIRLGSILSTLLEDVETGLVQETQIIAMPETVSGTAKAD